MRGVLLMMGQNCDGILRCRRAVGISCRTKGRFANRTAIDEELGLLINLEIVPSGDLHEQFVRMLAVHYWQTISRFSGLEKLGISSVGNGGRLETQHCSERDRIPTVLTQQHRHQPIY